MLAQATGGAAERDRVLFELLLASGIRIGSALALDVEDVALERGEIYLRTTKNDRPFTAFINGRLVALLGRHIGDRTSGPLFESRHGLRLSSRQVARRLAHWCREAAIKGPSFPHALRHSFGQRIYDQTHDPFAVMQALGHKAIASSMVYARSDPGRLRALMG